MDTSAIIAVLAVIVVLVVAVLVARPLLRRRRLQERFGPEYDRAVQDYEGRAVAERELVEREKRYKELELRTLAPEDRDRYAERWMLVQAQFVDAPESTVREADRLVIEVMAERGYPTEGYEQQLADLSVEHAATLEHYRAAHEIHDRVGGEQVSTEDLRNAMVHYRALFVDLLGPQSDGDRATRRDGTAVTGAEHPDVTADGYRMDAEAAAADRRDTVAADRRDTVAGDRRMNDGLTGADRRDLDADGHRGDRTADGRDVAGVDADAEIADAQRSRSDRRGTVR